MKTTQQYFNLTINELIDSDLTEYTKEEKLLFDSGLEIVFFDDEKEFKEEAEDFEKYLDSNKYEIKEILTTVNERIAVILI